MPNILIPLNAGESPAVCAKHKEPVRKESYISYEVTETELSFWKMLSNEEKRKYREEAFQRCFYDIIHEAMAKTKRMFHQGE